MPRDSIRALAAGLFCLCLLSSSAQAQLGSISESVDVRVVNIDVVVTDEDGTPVPGLEQGDFELIVAGKPVEVEYFTAIEGGVTESAASEAPGADSHLPLLIIDYDARSTRPGVARGAFDALRAQLDELLASSRAIMVVRQGMSLVVEQPFTRNRELLDAALGRLASMKVPALNSMHRDLLIARLERAVDPQFSGLSEEDEGVLDEALALLTEVRSQGENERNVMAGAAGQLRSLVGSVSGLPGRKALLYLGPGFQPIPGESLYRIWWSKYASVAGGLGIGSIESEMGINFVSSDLTRLLESANEHQVSFYGHDPRGVRSGGGSVQFESVAASAFTEDETQAQQQWIHSLADGSGGVARINSSDLDGLIEEMNAGFHTYYSLGFTPSEELPDKGKVKIKLVERKGKVRHFDRFVTESPTRGLEELTLAALMTEIASNPLEIEVELGEAERQSDGTYVVPLLVKVPISLLTLIPEGDQHVGRLTVVVQAMGAEGELSEPAQGAVPIELANSDLLSSLAGMAGYRLRMRVKAGEQKIAIGVRDEVGLTDSALGLMIATGRDS